MKAAAVAAANRRFWKIEHRRPHVALDHDE
jgi:hypothetical protein